MKISRKLIAGGAALLVGGSLVLGSGIANAATVLPYVNASNQGGWGDLLNGTFTADGIQLNATSIQEAYAYLDFDPPAQFRLSEAGSLTTQFANKTGSFGVILQNTTWNIHYENDGMYWTNKAGLFPMTSAGFYSTYDLSTATADPVINEIAVWVNPGGSLLLKSQDFDGFTQPFGATPAGPAQPVNGNASFTG